MIRDRVRILYLLFLWHEPAKTKRIKRNSQPKWFKEDLNKGIQKRDYLLKKARKINSPKAWKNYKETKNTVTRLIRTQKVTYFKSHVHENQQNPKKLWSLLKDLSRESSRSNIHLQQLEDNSEITTDVKILRTYLTPSLRTFGQTQLMKLKYPFLWIVKWILKTLSNFPGSRQTNF